MSQIDRALADNPFEIDLIQCSLSAEALKTFSPADSINPWSAAPVSAQVAFKLFFISICHQINWDFLQRRMFEHFFSTDVDKMLESATVARPQYVSEMLNGYHREERIKARERAKYLQETALMVKENFSNDPTRLVNSRRIFGTDGLLDHLTKIPAFSEDPLSKKSNAFAQELAREGIIIFSDADLIPPAIDYHLIRLYLRTGRVIANNPAVFQSLSTETTHRMRLVKLLRVAVSEALTSTASFAKMPVHQLNYIEWQVARNRCEREFTNCDGAWPSELIDQSVSRLSDCCPLRDCCNAYRMPEWKAMLEPTLKKAFY
jgi:hypothetical protein